MTPLRARITGIDRPRLDALLAIVIIAELELEIWLGSELVESHRPLTAVAAVLVIAPVAARRRWPAGALVCCSVLATTQALLGGRLGATSGLGIMLGLVVLAFTRERNRRVAAFRELAVQAAAEREERKRAAIAEERVRIGRELQDIIAHNVSAMVIQTGGARQLLRTDPKHARATILNVEQVGREALGDLRRVLGMLRKDEDPSALAPQPGLDQLPTLLDSMRETGLECHLHLEGEPLDLTPGVNLVGYRVIEAALHTAATTGCRRAAVTVRYRLDDLELEVQSGDSIPDLDQTLRWISERVALYGGSLRLAPADGFALHAHLPLAASVTA
jgi:signal transduction histidine kinase